MESSDSSPHYMRATSSSHAKKENSPGMSEFDDMDSVNPSTNRTASKQKVGIKYRTNNKKALINLGNAKSFRRRTKSRILLPVDMSDCTASPLDSSEAVSSCSKASGCSNGEKFHSQLNPRCSVLRVDSGGVVSPHSNLVSKRCVPLKALSRSSSIRNVRILVKRSSFKPKKRLLKYSGGSDVHRATYSSTSKDLKFPVPAEILAETADVDGIPPTHCCRYSHCSLHGHSQECRDSAAPPKRFLEKRRELVKTQKDVISNPYRSSETEHFGDTKVNLQESQTSSCAESSVELKKNDSAVSSDVSCMLIGEPPNPHPYQDGSIGIKDFDLLEIAFGETSFPETSYRVNLEITRRYSMPEKERTTSGLRGYCLKCFCELEEQNMFIPRTADVDLPKYQVSAASSIGSNCNNEIPQNVDDQGCDTLSLPFSKQEHFISSEDCGTFEDTADQSISKTPLAFDEVNKDNPAFSPVSDSQFSSDTNSEVDGESTNESAGAGCSLASEVAVANDSVINVPSDERKILQFSKPRHISMWHLIHQHMASEMAAESVNKSLHVDDGENLADTSNPLLCKGSSSASSQEISDSLISEENSLEVQDIETRKLCAIKLVREAIERILLPEIQDDQSITSESTPRQELIEKKETEVPTKESYEELDTDKVPGDAPANPKDMSSSKMEKNTATKSEKKAPKHWSNLKKWILLQRFIKELEKVRKFNPEKPLILPLNPDTVAEKVNLRSQTVDAKKKGEEWMLDYALRQAVNQLAPTQKRKVALLVKAFETVVPPQEDSPVQRRTSKLNENNSQEELSVNPEARQSNKALRLKFENQANVTGFTRKSWDLSSIGALTSTRTNLVCSTGESEESECGKGKPSSQSLWISKDNGIKMATEKSEIKILENTSFHFRDQKELLSFQSERKNHINLWHMIYQHVVSGIADKVGSQLLNGSDEDDDEKSPQAVSDDYNGVMCNNPKSGFTKADALKLVKDAVNEILVAETQDYLSDTQSITSDLAENTETSEENRGEQKTLKSNNWVKLKKLLVLKKSIKVLEKAREVNQQTSELLTQIPEKVELKQQMMDERKRAKQWMLDYAVQHIVDKLTPARRLRVSMLVEAFEAVVPLPEM